MTMVRAQSQNWVSYIDSTEVSIELNDSKWLSYFEEDFGSAAMNEINRPNIARTMRKYLPLVDEYDKQR